MAASATLLRQSGTHEDAGDGANGARGVDALRQKPTFAAPFNASRARLVRRGDLERAACVDPLGQVRDVTGGLGVAAVVECAGTATAIRDCCLAAGKGGVVSVIGIPHEEPRLPMKRIVLDEIEIVGDRANPNTAEEALSLLVHGRIDLTPLFTHRFPLAEFASALETFETRRDGAIEVAIKP